MNSSMLRVLAILGLAVCLAVYPAKAQEAADAASPEIWTPPDWVKATMDVAYGDGAAHRLDVYTPLRGAEGKRPGVLLIHGGGWRSGSRRSVAKVHALPFLEKGFVVAAIDYRLSDEAKAPAAVSDTLQALDWFHRNAKLLQVDRDRIITAGYSAGAHLALLAGMVDKKAKLGPTSDVAAIINCYGAADLSEQLTRPEAEGARAWLPAGTGGVEMSRVVSPINYVRKGLPPVKSIHGTEDPTVPYEQSVRLTRSLRRVGVTAELLSIPGAKHGFEEAVWHNEVYPQVFEFLTRQKVLR